MESNLKLKVISYKDLGWTEDEVSNFLIDMHIMLKKIKEPQEVKITSGPAVTVTLTKNNFFK